MTFFLFSFCVETLYFFVVYLFPQSENNFFPWQNWFPLTKLFFLWRNIFPWQNFFSRTKLFSMTKLLLGQESSCDKTFFWQNFLFMLKLFSIINFFYKDKTFFCDKTLFHSETLLVTKLSFQVKPLFHDKTLFTWQNSFSKTKLFSWQIFFLWQNFLSLSFPWQNSFSMTKLFFMSKLFSMTKLFWWQNFFCCVYHRGGSLGRKMCCLITAGTTVEMAPWALKAKKELKWMLWDRLQMNMRKGIVLLLSSSIIQY